MNKELLVSILINNFNYGCFLENAIDSALGQTYENIEVVVVDDGSTDNSLDIIQSYGNQITSVIKKNGGQASAFNRGFAHSHGNIICFLDADDVFVNDKIEKIVHIFQEYKQVGWCFHPIKLVNSDLSDSSKHKPAVYTGKSGVYDIQANIHQGRLRGTLPFLGTATSGLCFSRSLLQQILPMPEEIRITSDDYLKYSAFGRSAGYVILEELALQRIHGDNAYTLRNDKKALRANIEMLTAYWLRQNTPPLARFSNTVFAGGLSKHQSIKEIDIERQKKADQYLSLVSLPERLEISLRALYCRIKY